MCCHNIESDSRAHTKFMLHARPKPPCEVVYVKLLSHWSCVEPERVLLSVNLASFLVCACRFTCHDSRMSRLLYDIQQYDCIFFIKTDKVRAKGKT